MKSLGKKLQKIATAFLLVSFLFTQSPFVAHALWGAGDIAIDPSDIGFDAVNSAQTSLGTGFDIKDFIKDFVLDPLAYTLASRIAERLTQRIVGWANRGFDGNPFYIENYPEFFQDLGKDVINEYVYELKDSTSPFVNTILRSIDRDYYRNLVNIPDQFSLDVLFGENWEDHNQNFASGGWELYLARWEPANNPFGAYLETRDQLMDRISSKEQAVSIDLQGNNGYLSFQKCVDPPGWRIGQTETVSVPGSGDIPDLTREVSVPCRRWETQTPGNAIYEQVTRGLNDPLERLANANKYGEIVSASLNAMIAALVQGGLRKLSDTIDTSITSITSSNVSSPEEAATLARWANYPDQVIDLERELDGFSITEDSNGVTLVTPIVRPGAIALTTSEIAVWRDILNNEEYGLRTFPPILMELDHVIPGPDRNWTQRLRDTLNGDRRYKKIEKRANKDNSIGADEEQILADIDAALAQLGPLVTVNMFDPEEQIPGFNEYFDMVSQIDDLDSQTQEIQDTLQRKSRILSLLVSIKEQVDSGSLSEEEYNKLAFQYTRLREITTPEVLADTESRREEIVLLRDKVLEQIEDAQQEVNTKKQQDPAWGQLYDSKDLFCKELVDAINDADTKDELNIQCSQFYTSTIIDYINRYNAI